MDDKQNLHEIGRKITKLTRSVVTSSTVNTVFRRLVRPFPRLEEDVEVWVYYLIKRLNHTAQGSRTINTYQEVAQTAVSTDDRQLLIDISQVVVRDFHTGVSRVVRSILLELLNHPPAGYRVEPVYVNAFGQLLYAREFTKVLLKTEGADVFDSPVVVHHGDIFYTSDIYVIYPFETLAALHNKGVQVIFTVHDLIPLNDPMVVRKYLRVAFADWFYGVLTVADKIVCVSQSVAEELRHWIEEHPSIRNYPLPISFFHLGADIEASNPSHGDSQEGVGLLEAIHKRPTLLMVGTLEPRKGHPQVLAAVESLWAGGLDLNLVIIGQEGRRIGKLSKYLERHCERNQRLFWLNSASDSLLLTVYAQATALVAASTAEGFGLPLIEAARHGLPIIARDIPVFREVAGRHAFYFSGDGPEALAKAIRQWFTLYAEGRVPLSKDMPWLTWRQSVEQLLAAIIPFSEEKIMRD